MAASCWPSWGHGPGLAGGGLWPGAVDGRSRCTALACIPAAGAPGARLHPPYSAATAPPATDITSLPPPSARSLAPSGSLHPCTSYSGIDTPNTVPAVMADRFTWSTFARVTVGNGSGNVSLGLNPYRNASWHMWLHSLRWVGQAITAGAAGDAAALNHVRSIAKDWVLDNPYPWTNDVGAHESTTHCTNVLLCLREAIVTTSPGGVLPASDAWLDNALLTHGVAHLGPFGLCPQRDDGAHRDTAARGGNQACTLQLSERGAVLRDVRPAERRGQPGPRGPGAARSRRGRGAGPRVRQQGNQWQTLWHLPSDQIVKVYSRTTAIATKAADSTRTILFQVPFRQALPAGAILAQKGLTSPRIQGWHYPDITRRTAATTVMFARSATTASILSVIAPVRQTSSVTYSLRSGGSGWTNLYLSVGGTRVLVRISPGNALLRG